MAAIGTVMSGSVRSRVATLINEYEGDPYYKGNDGGSQSGKTRLMAAVEDACKVAGASDAADQGTEFHSLWEIVNKGEDPKVVQPHLVEPLRKYKIATEKIKFIDAEYVVVNDELKRAGSVDHLMVVPKGSIGPNDEPLDEDWVCVGDGKTGRWDVRYPAGVYAQLATYALAERYDQDENYRAPIHPNLNTDWAVMIHYPLSEKDPEVGLYWMDISVGRRAALLNNSLDAMVKWFSSVAGRPRKFTTP